MSLLTAAACLAQPAACLSFAASSRSTARAFRSIATRPASRPAGQPSHPRRRRQPTAALDGMIAGLRRALGQVKPLIKGA